MIDKTWPILVILFSVGSLFKLSFPLAEIHISWLDLGVLLYSVYFLIRNITKIPGIIKNNKLAKYILIFYTVGLISLLINALAFDLKALLVGFMYWSRGLMYGLLYIPLSFLFKKSSLKLLLISLGLATVLTGLGQYLFSPDIRSLEVAEWDPHYYRVVGTLLDPGYIGIILVMFFLILIYHQDRIKKIIFWLMAIPAYLVLAFTYSRSSFLAFLAGMTAISVKRKSVKPFIISLLLLTATIFLLPRSSGGEGVKLERTGSIQARIINWQRTIKIFSNNFILGVGFNTYRYAQRKAGFLDNNKWLKSHSGAGADSSLLFVAATTGIVGLFFYLRFLGRLWNYPSDFPLYIPLSALIVHSTFLNSLFFPHVLFVLGVILSLYGLPKDGTKP
jgi:hypothetical protein